MDLGKTRTVSKGSWCALTQKSGRNRPGVPPNGANTSFVFLSSVQRDLFATYPAQILTIFETKDVSQCQHAYTFEKFWNLFIGDFSGPENS